MKKLSKNLNVILLGALTSAALFTWIGPKVLSLLFTPPVSFGMNCEPAAAWSMQKLIWTQAIGLGIGAIAGMVYVSSRKTAPPVVTEPAPANA